MVEAKANLAAADEFELHAKHDAHDYDLTFLAGSQDGEKWIILARRSEAATALCPTKQHERCSKRWEMRVSNSSRRMGGALAYGFKGDIRSRCGQGERSKPHTPRSLTKRY